MAAHLIVDGHNVIFCGDRYADAYGKNPQGTREKLMRDLAAFGARKGYRVTVAFDSGKGGGFSRGHEEMHGVSARYSRGGEPADAVIEEMLQTMPRGEAVFVASNDRGVQASARAAKAQVWTAEQLLSKIGPNRGAPKPF